MDGQRETSKEAAQGQRRDQSRRQDEGSLPCALKQLP